MSSDFSWQHTAQSPDRHTYDLIAHLRQLAPKKNVVRLPGFSLGQKAVERTAYHTAVKAWPASSTDTPETRILVDIRAAPCLATQHLVRPSKMAHRRSRQSLQLSLTYPFHKPLDFCCCSSEIFEEERKWFRNEVRRRVL